MIEFLNLSEERPYQKFKFFFDKAVEKKQEAIDAICISSYDKDSNQPDARFVNLKYISNDEWIFFSNYEGPKAKQFRATNNISATFYWQKIDTQIRINAKIKKTNSTFSDNHYKRRSDLKNALAISSNQSKIVESYEKVIKNYENTLKKKDLISNRPDYWGGYSFKPYYFEFWEGNDSRLNKREVYSFENNKWENHFLQP